MARQTDAEVRRDIGLRVAECREVESLTQEQFAAKIRVSVKYLQAIEAGNQNVTVSTIVKLANGLNVDVVQLFHVPLSTTRRRPGRLTKNRD